MSLLDHLDAVEITDLKITLLNELARSRYPRGALGDLAGKHGLTIEEARSLVSKHGFPIADAMTRAAHILAGHTTTPKPVTPPKDEATETPAEPGIGRKIQLRQLDDHPANPPERVHDVDELTASIQQVGVLQPLLVTPHPQDAGRWVILAGHRRAAADLHQENPSRFPRTDCLWASPECTKWSQANGSKQLPAIDEGLFEDPLSDEATQRSRLLMFDVLKFIEHHRYRLVIIENVVDIATQAKYRNAWHVWRQDLRNLRYQYRVISLNAMHAQLFGRPAPQSRDRIFIACWPEGESAPDFERALRPRAYCPRCDRMVESRQAWKPGKTVGRYRQAYVYVHGDCGTTVEPGYLPAAAAIDWTILGERIGERLKPKTRARIAAGIARYWGAFHLEASGNQYDAADPNHPQHGDPDAYYRTWSVDDVLRTLHTTESKALAVPVEGRDGKSAQPMGWPLRTQTTRLETAMVTPFIAELRGGYSDARSVNDPAATFCASGNHHGLVTPSGGSWNDDARTTDQALRTLTTRDAYALVTPYYGTARSALPIDEPLGTLTTVDRYALVHRNNTGGAEMTTPVDEYLRTLTSAGHQALIQAGPRGGRPKVSPADLKAAEEMVSECLFRMFRPMECAAGQAFPADYDWAFRDEKGRTPSNRDLVRMIGNAVPPPASRDLVGCATEDITGEAA